jgi:cytochrome c oxidase subunit 2
MTETARYVNTQFAILLWFSGVVFVGIIAVMVAFVIRYRRSRHPVAVDIRGNRLLEALWIIIPTILVLGIFYVGLTGYLFLRRAPADAMDVKVLAFQYGWEFEYENGRKNRRLMVPEDRPVRLLLTSRDVIHSFFVPDFRIKQDAVPGLTTSLWFEATEPGQHDVLCAEYCGLAHSDMLTKVVVVPPEEFEVWYQAAPPP